ncbi:uncharacterized protein LOC123263985 [Cotesia glomerata]|uniref:uncharacterized protein LOC123263985 n=1 Tax=Cotesia glomerata TaxID=32391 RepID=UPI001D0212EB|nr:uncharacterized protein LOC123263985 [Cotesia glomerata]
MKLYENKIVIPLYLYYDDFEVCNPLSTAAGIYKIGGLYFSIAALPPEFSSSVDSIFLAQLLYTSDLKTFGNEKCFSNVIEQLTDLANTGVSIIIDGDTKHLFFVTVGILGDNLGVNSIFGYNESFVATYFCRFCQASKAECYQQCKEDVKLLRNCENYAEDVKNLSHGVKESCVFDKLPFFHHVINATCDVMHDFSLGVCRYDMAKIIKHCIDEKYFTLQQLNDRIKYFDHSEFDHGNKVSTISKNHIQNGCIIITAAEMSCLVTYFGIIIGDLVPFDDPVWELYLCLFDIYDIVMSSTISQSEIIHLEQLIKLHNQLYIESFSENLKPKHHLILHVPSIIKNMGPANEFSYSKYESFHKLSKAQANIVNSRVNIIYTVALKIQLHLCYKFISESGLEDRIEYGDVSDLDNYTDNAFSFWKSIEKHSVSWLKVNGTLYKPSYLIYVKNDVINEQEKASWLSFKEVCIKFLSNTKDADYEYIVANMIANFQRSGCLMNLKLHFFNSHLNYFPENNGDFSEEQGERFHHDLKELGW